MTVEATAAGGLRIGADRRVAPALFVYWPVYGVVIGSVACVVMVIDEGFDPTAALQLYGFVLGVTSLLGVGEAVVQWLRARTAYELDERGVRVLWGARVVRSWRWGELEYPRLVGSTDWRSVVGLQGRVDFPYLLARVDGRPVRAPSILLWGRASAAEANAAIKQYALDVGRTR